MLCSPSSVALEASGFKPSSSLSNSRALVTTKQTFSGLMSGMEEGVSSMMRMTGSLYSMVRFYGQALYPARAGFDVVAMVRAIISIGQICRRHGDLVEIDRLRRPDNAVGRDFQRVDEAIAHAGAIVAGALVDEQQRMFEPAQVLRRHRVGMGIG